MPEKGLWFASCPINVCADLFKLWQQSLFNFTKMFCCLKSAIRLAGRSENMNDFINDHIHISIYEDLLLKAYRLCVWHSKHWSVELSLELVLLQPHQWHFVVVIQNQKDLHNPCWSHHPSTHYTGPEYLFCLSFILSRLQVSADLCALTTTHPIHQSPH